MVEQFCVRVLQKYYVGDKSKVDNVLSQLLETVRLALLELHKMEKGEAEDLIISCHEKWMTFSKNYFTRCEEILQQDGNEDLIMELDAFIRPYIQ
jgi:hypothetical protein